MRSRGFTLLELSIVLIIIALVTGMAITSGVSVITTARLTATQNKMRAIDDALMKYRIANDRLPCPADLTLTPTNATTGTYYNTTAGADYGLEAGADLKSNIPAGTGVCSGSNMTPAAKYNATGLTNTLQTAAEGAVPAVTLGLPPDFMYDGWGNRFRYAVDINYTAGRAFSSTGAACLNGAITVEDMNHNARSANVIYALISHGANGHGAYTRNGVPYNASSQSVDELTNCHCTASGAYNNAYSPLYIQKTSAYDTGKTGNTSYYFDDLVSYKERWQMQTSTDKPGGCPYLYVADTNNNRIVKLDTKGNYIAQFPTSCSSLPCSTAAAGGQFTFPMGVAVDSSGNVWVADWLGNRIQELNSTGTFLQQIGCTPVGTCLASSASTAVYKPLAITLDKNNNVWVTEQGNERVHAFTSSGVSLISFGSSGTGQGQFQTPQGIAMDPSGNFVWVSDQTNNNIQKFDLYGNWQKQVGSCSWGQCAANTAAGAFYWPNGFAFDNSGNMWAPDLGGSRVQEINPTTNQGTQIVQFPCGSGACNSDNTPGDFQYPVGAAFDLNGNLWTVEINGNRVQEFSGTTLIGGPFTSSFNGPNGIAFGLR